MKGFLTLSFLFINYFIKGKPSPLADVFLRMVSVKKSLLYKFVSFLAKSKVDQCGAADRWGEWWGFVHTCNIKYLKQLKIFTQPIYAACFFDTMATWEKQFPKPKIRQQEEDEQHCVEIFCREKVASWLDHWVNVDLHCKTYQPMY